MSNYIYQNIPRFTSMADNLQVLGGVLIVLSLALLYCWSQKRMGNTRNRRCDGMQSSNNNHLSQFEELTAHNTPDLRFNANVTRSMHDLEGLSVTRHSPTELQRKVDIVGLKWNTEGIDASDTTDMFDRSNNDRRQSHHQCSGCSNRSLGGDILTPMNKSMNESTWTTHSGDQLTMTDHAMDYCKCGTT